MQSTLQFYHVSRILDKEAVDRRIQQEFKSGQKVFTGQRCIFPKWPSYKIHILVTADIFWLHHFFFQFKIYFFVSSPLKSVMSYRELSLEGTPFLLFTWFPSQKLGVDKHLPHSVIGRLKDLPKLERTGRGIFTIF